MKKSKGKYWVNAFFTFLFLITISIQFSQSTSFTTQVSHSKVGIDDYFTVTYKSNKKGQFIAPKFKDFDASGPTQGSNTSISIVNGQMSQDVSYNFTYTLKAKKTGDFTIPGAQIKVDNATFESQPVTVTVVQESQVRQRSRSQSVFDFDNFFGNTRPQSQQPLTDDDFFARIELSKTKVYEGEFLVASYKLYSRGLSVQLEDYNFPTHEGFWTENIELPQNLVPVNKVIDGKQYQIYTIRQELLFPQRDGKINLKPFDVTARLNQSFFSVGTQKKIVSNTSTIESLPLPLGAPSNFVNQVGEFNFQVQVLADTVKVDEPVDVKVTVSGKGNLKQLGQLTFDFPVNFDTYDPTLKDNLTVSTAGISGTKTFNYLVIPRNSGKYEFGPLSFSYFDLTSKSYKTINSKNFSLVVLNQEGKVDNRVVHSSNNSVVVNEEIEGIEHKSLLKFEGDYFFNSWGYYAILVSLGGLFLAFILLSKRWEKNNEDTIENKIKKARKKLEKRMALAKNYMDNNQSSAFYTETIKSLYQYSSDKLQLETSQMSKTTITKSLIEKGVSNKVTQEFITLLEQCEMAQYASLSSISNQEIYAKSLRVIEEIENEFNS